MDNRLSQLLANGFTCAGCGERHQGLFDIAFDYPDTWTGSPEKEPNSAVGHALAQGLDFLSDDFCVIGEYRFVRCILPLHLIGTDENFAFGLWGSLSQSRFLEYVDIFDSPNGSSFGPAFSWLMNRLPRAADAAVRAELQGQVGRQRPLLTLREEDHPFFKKQGDGLTYDDLLSIYAHYGHRLVLN